MGQGRIAGALVAMALAPGAAVPAAAEVVRIEVRAQQDWAQGQVFGAGAYETVSGVAWYEIDPDAPDARDITDVRLAPRNARGRVEYHGPFLILRPKQAAKANGTAVFEVANRGGDQSNRILFHADRFDLTRPEATREVAHGPLFDRGYTFAWAGWQADLKAEEFGLTVPRAAVNGTARATSFLNVDGASGDVGSVRVGESCAADANDPGAVLRIQRRFDDPGTVVPRSAWRLARRDPGGIVVADRCAFVLDTPVKGPALATVTFRGDQPQVTGLGLAAVRDFAGWLRGHEIAGRAGPRTIIAYGYSQSARFLRDFLFRGFNRGPGGGRVFDGMLDSGAGAGRGSFDHRYARPGDAGNSVGSALRPVDLYPFADLPAADIAGRRQAGLLDRARRDGVVPKLFHILSGSEYWARAGSLMQATPDGRRALPQAAETRTYVFAGTNHAPRPALAFLAAETRIGYPYNDNADAFGAMPALTEAMRRWIVEDMTPPASQRPEVGETLVSPGALAFPRLPGVTVSTAPPPVWQLDFGARYRRDGIPAEPPRIGPRYTLLVPQVDTDGNEIGGWQGPRRSLPVGTYTAWNASDPDFAGFGILSGLSGALIPFPWDEADRVARGDPRRSVLERYGSREGYMRATEREIERQVAAGFLLPDERRWTRDAMLVNWTRGDALRLVWPRPGD